MVDPRDVVEDVEEGDEISAYPPTTAIMMTMMTITAATVRLRPTFSFFTIKFEDSSMKVSYLERSVLNEG